MTPYIRRLFSLSFFEDLSLCWRHIWSYVKALAIKNLQCTLSNVCLTLSWFYQLSFTQYMGLCVFRLLIYLMIATQIGAHSLSIVMRSKVGIISHCMGLGFEARLRVLCLTMFLTISHFNSFDRYIAKPKCLLTVNSQCDLHYPSPRIGTSVYTFVGCVYLVYNNITSGNNNTRPIIRKTVVIYKFWRIVKWLRHPGL